MANVVLDHVRKVYDDGFVAVHDATLDIQDGEFVVLVGPSGCGKSTTLRMIAGLETISAGTLSIGGRVVNDVAPKDRDIAMVFQNYALYPHMTVFDNMAFGLKLRKFPAPEVETRVRQAADTLGLTSVLDRKPKALSGGQRQRVALGRAIVRKPSVFLFDEPLSNLDAKLRVQTRTEIARLHRQLGATMVYVTHDQVEAMTMGDRIVVLKDGHIQQVAAPLELYDTPANAFVAGFIGSPSMNFIEGVVNEDRTFVAAREAFRFSLSNRADHLETGPVTLGVRPEDLYVDGVAPPSRTLSEPLAAVIENLEPMGNEVVLYARPGGGDTLVARVEPQELPSAGETAMLRIDVGAIHFFDSSSGVALTRRPARSAA